MAAPVGPKKVRRCKLSFKLQAAMLASRPDMRMRRALIAFPAVSRRCPPRTGREPPGRPACV